MAIPKQRESNPLADARCEATARIERTRRLVEQRNELHDERNELVALYNSQKRRHGERDYRVRRSEQPHIALMLEIGRAIERVDAKIHAWWAEFLSGDHTFEMYDFDEVVVQVRLERGDAQKAIARGADSELRSVEVNDSAELKSVKRQRKKLRDFYTAWLARVPDPSSEVAQQLRRKIETLT